MAQATRMCRIIIMLWMENKCSTYFSVFCVCVHMAPFENRSSSMPDNAFIIYECAYLDTLGMQPALCGHIDNIMITSLKIIYHQSTHYNPSSP
jgi:hypothetical protein